MRSPCYYLAIVFTIFGVFATLTYTFLYGDFGPYIVAILISFSIFLSSLLVSAILLAIDQHLNNQKRIADCLDKLNNTFQEKEHN